MFKKTIFLIVFVFALFLTHNIPVQAAYSSEVYDSLNYNINNYRLDNQGNPWFLHYDSVSRQQSFVRLDWQTGEYHPLPPSTSINSFFDFDSQGNIWSVVYNSSGRTLSFTKTDSVSGENTVYNHSFSGNSYGIWIVGLVVDKYDNIWVINNNPSPDNDSKRCFIGYNEQAGYLGFYKVNQTANIGEAEIDSQGNIWVRSSRNYFFKFNINTKTFSQKTYPASSSAWVYYYDFDDTDMIWMRLANYTQNTLVRYNPNNNQLINYPIGFNTNDVLVSHNGQIFLSNYSGQSIVIYDQNGQMLETISTSPSRPQSFAQVLNHSIWLNEYDPSLGKHRLRRFYTDSAPPTTTLSLTGQEGNNNWYLSQVSAELESIDNLSGVEHIFYRIENGPWLEYQSPVVFSSEGVFAFDYYAQDQAGNIENVQSAQIKIDQTPPEIEGLLTPEVNEHGWYNTNVTAGFTCFDATSGIIQCSSPEVLSTEGENQLIVGFAQDQAGNIGSCDLAGINIDKTSPAVEIISPADGQSYLLNELLVVEWQAEDLLSGLFSTQADYPTGATISTDLVGEKSFSVVAVDLAGNQTSQTANYSIHYQFGGFLPPLDKDSFNLGSAVPVKFQLFDYQGLPFPEAVANLFLRDQGGEEIPASSKGKANDDNLFRYSVTDEHYIFNLDTKDLTAGEWTILLKLDDGAGYEAAITLVDKKEKGK